MVLSLAYQLAEVLPGMADKLLEAIKGHDLKGGDTAPTPQQLFER